MADGAHSAADEKLFAELGVTVQAQEHVEQSVIDQVLLYILLSPPPPG
jgi:hypothetical protein